jgi:hypothetical protein
MNSINNRLKITIQSAIYFKFYLKNAFSSAYVLTWAFFSMILSILCEMGWRTQAGHFSDGHFNFYLINAQLLHSMFY